MRDDRLFTVELQTLQGKGERRVKTKPMVFDTFDALFCYDPDTGIITNKVKRSKKSVIGAVSGSLNKVYGYRYVSVDRLNYYAHRVAWLLSHGEIDQTLAIDHLNGMRDDNRLSNLRLVTHIVNTRSRHRGRGELPLGVSRTKEGNKFRARVCRNRKEINLGVYHTATEAAQAYQSALAQGV